MCGIAGIVDPNSSPEFRRAAVGRMCDAMLHRGPDDGGLESRGPATLGARRLAIFDPANGHQPMQTPDGRVTVVFNGSIYNFHAIRDELASAGRTFRTNCDTEVLLAAWERWGEACIDRLRGMFAFAVWDAGAETLCLARDPFGIKPLYYRNDGERLVFASELNALLAGRVFSPEVDPASVSDYLAWLAVPAPWTIYRQVFGLRPGEYALFRRGRLEIRRAWTFRGKSGGPGRCASPEEFTRELRARLEDSIRAHMLADVPVGVFLSGGLDSAVVTGLMARASSSRLRTFSLGFAESGYSEAAEAEASARHFGTDHHARVLTGAEVARDIEKLIKALDRPTGDGVNTYYISQTAKAGGVTSALSGLGGDELFGGYPSFRDVPRLDRWLRLWRGLPGPARAAVVSRLRRGDTQRQKLADFLSYARDFGELSALQRRVLAVDRARLLLASEIREALGDRAPFHPELANLTDELVGQGSFESTSAWELRTYTSDVLLRDSDVMSMRHSLELRVPFIDRPLIEWLWRQPAAWKFHPRHPKRALAAATADLLPPALSSRRKRGFTLPFALWMRRELRPFLDETFSEASIARTGLFSSPQVQALWRGFLERDDPREWSRVWSVAMLIAFLNRGADAKTEGGEAGRSLAASPGPVAAKSVLGGANGGEAQASVKRPSPIGNSLTLLLTPEIFSSTGGIARMTRIYLRALCDLGAENGGRVRLVALNDPVMDSSDLRRYANGDLDDWYVCGRSKRRFVRAALSRGRGCDRLVCSHVAQLPVAWLLRRLHPRLRYYLVAHGIEVWRPFTLAERVALRGAARVFCVSAYTRDQLLSHCPLRRDRVLVLPNALDPFFEIAPGPPPGESPPVVLSVSRLSSGDRYKGIEHLIQAMPAIRRAEPDARLRVVGHGDDLARLQGMARGLGLLHRGVEFLGNVEDKLLRREFQGCRLFALPSQREGFGLAFLEAMAHGRPCLAAREGGAQEVVTDETGIFVPYGDIPAIAAGCIAGLRRAWSQQAMLDRARMFSYPSFKQRLASVLSS